MFMKIKYLNLILIACLTVVALVACEEQTAEPVVALEEQAMVEAPETLTDATGERLAEIPANGTVDEQSLVSPDEPQQPQFNVPSRRRTGDLDTMEQVRVIRVLTVYGLGRYFLDGGREKGLTYEL